MGPDSKPCDMSDGAKNNDAADCSLPIGSREQLELRTESWHHCQNSFASGLRCGGSWRAFGRFRHLKPRFSIAHEIFEQNLHVWLAICGIVSLCLFVCSHSAGQLREPGAKSKAFSRVGRAARDDARWKPEIWPQRDRARLSPLDNLDRGRQERV